MNEKIMEKLKSPEFLKKIIVLPDAEKVKEEFRKEGIEVEDKDLKEIRDLIKCFTEMVSNLSSEELKKFSAGYRDGVVDSLSNQVADFAYYRGSDGSFSKGFYDTLYKNSDKLVEVGLAAALIGGTIGVQKLIKAGKGWWTKDYWVKKK